MQYRSQPTVASHFSASAAACQMAAGTAQRITIPPRSTSSSNAASGGPNRALARLAVPVYLAHTHKAPTFLRTQSAVIYEA